MNISEYSVRCSHFSSALLVSVSAVAAIGATPCVRCPRRTWANRDAVRRASGNPRQQQPPAWRAHNTHCFVALFQISHVYNVRAHTCRSVCGDGNQVHLQISVWTTILLHICDKFVTAARHRARNNQVWKLQKWVVRSFLLWLHLHSWCPLLAVAVWHWGCVGEDGRPVSCLVCRVVIMVSPKEWGWGR